MGYRKIIKFINNKESTCQCCATGLTSEGKAPKSLVEEMVPLLDSREVMCVDTRISHHRNV